MRVRAATVLVAVLAAAGCGGTSARTDADQVRSAWRSAATAIAGGDGTAFCELASPAGRRLLERRTQLGCEDAVRLLAARLPAADRTAIGTAPITRVTVRGDHAVVTYRTTRALSRYGMTGRTELVRSGDRWLLQGI